MHTKLPLCILIVLCVSPVKADDNRNAIPIRKWLVSTHDTLVNAARKAPLSKVDRMWDALDACVPERPVELRAQIEKVRWKDGVAKITIGLPVGWPTQVDTKYPTVRHSTTYYVSISEAEAALLPGAWFICIAPWTIEKNYSEFYSKKRSTHAVIATVRVDSGKTGYFVTDKLSLEIKGRPYTAVLDKTF